MTVTKKDVEEVAKLARLEFTENEKLYLIKDLNSILTYVDKLNELNTKEVDIIVNPYYIENKLREDKIEPSLALNEVIENAPEHIEEYIVVPKLME